LAILTLVPAVSMTSPTTTTLTSPKPSAVSTLVDTGVWFALADRRDHHHDEAREFYSGRVGQTNFVTTDLILAETWTLVHARLGRQATLKYWSGLREAHVPIVTVLTVDWKRRGALSSRSRINYSVLSIVLRSPSWSASGSRTPLRLIPAS
jgi:hypothetical protein